MAQLSAIYLASLILRSIGIALIAGICSWKIRNVAVRHAVWVGVLGILLLLPAADYVLPASWVPARIQQVAAKQTASIRVASARATVQQHSTPAPAAATLPNSPNPVNLWNVAATLYALVAFAMFIRLALGYRKVRKLCGTARAITSTFCEEIVGSQRMRWRMPVLLESESVQVPMTIGFRRPAIILPADWKTWDDWKMRAVLLHELAHVRRVDWGIAVVAAAAKCTYWLNPLCWFLERRLSQLAERASDDATLSDTQNPTRYAEILLEFAVAAQSGGRLMKGGVAMSQPCMKARIERVLGNPKTGTGIVKTAGWILLMLSAAPVIYSAAALQVTSSPVKAPAPTYTAELGWSPWPQAPTAGPPEAPNLASTSGPGAQQKSTTSAAELQGPFQLDLQIQTLHRKDLEARARLQELKQENKDGSPAAIPFSSDGPSLTSRESPAYIQRYRAELRAMEDLQRDLQLQLQNSRLQETKKTSNSIPSAEIRDRLRLLEFLQYRTSKDFMEMLAASDEERTYVIKPNDLLEILVYGIAELTLKVTVSPDGRISIPLVKNLIAAGLTPIQLKEEIDKRLKEFAMPESVVVLLESK